MRSQVLSWTILILIFSGISNMVQAQPGYSIYFAFKLYDRNGKQVEKEDICSNWSLTVLNNSGSLNPCDENDLHSIRMDSNKNLIANLTNIIPYLDLPWLINVAPKTR